EDGSTARWGALAPRHGRANPSQVGSLKFLLLNFAWVIFVQGAYFEAPAYCDGRFTEKYNLPSFLIIPRFPT
ncbi:MAG: hypothetical protein P8L44_20065, partial [Opitutales bacterium]|nr:hypothetical protein [Opitutales bacterium]